MIHRPQLASRPIPLLFLLCGVGARMLTYITSLSTPGADSLAWGLFPRVKQSDWPSDSAWKEERCVGLGRSHSTHELLSAGQGSTHRQGCRSLRTIQVGRTEVRKFWFLSSGPALTQTPFAFVRGGDHLCPALQLAVYSSASCWAVNPGRQGPCPRTGPM